MGDLNSTKADASGIVVRTICEVHREVYRKIHTLQEKGEIKEEDYGLLTSRLEEAFNYAKKMNNKLRQYKYNYDEGWWQTHKLDGGQLSEIDRVQVEIENKKSDENNI